ncbi:VOC family protein [Kitasatospora sp. GAS204B]|uniref:VOC family protein n=1 Tax=unclassified Kitasatospora TaxID=2633591 RepID=UPI0024768A08|nr:VOC family protein [Kitasatospora sp. GAS204B]MDH6117089.1 putative enzyme related to lactoylglutathione lyase [Kitasatospora sp. GAS204B]
MLTTNYVPGAPNWLDLGSPDTDAAQAFYSGLLGWTFNSAGPNSGGYGFFQLGDRTVAALGPLTEEGAPPAWTLYFHTEDADQTSKLVQQAGGVVRLGPFDVFTHGRMAGYTDPTGARFAVWQPGDTPGLEAVTDVGTLCWTELHTTDPSAAKPFYRTVFNWLEQDVPFGDFTYTVITPTDGGTDASQGGLAGMVAEDRAAHAGSYWQPYFEVADVDATIARAVELGGTQRGHVVEEAGVGRFAQLSDPQGAVFAVITGAPAEE